MLIGAVVIVGLLVALVRLRTDEDPNETADAGHSVASPSRPDDPPTPTPTPGAVLSVRRVSTTRAHDGRSKPPPDGFGHQLVYDLELRQLFLAARAQEDDHGASRLWWRPGTDEAIVPRDGHLALFDVSSGDILTFDLPAPDDGAWSHDGTRFAFTVKEGSLQVLDIPAGTVARLRYGGWEWSPDDARLALRDRGALQVIELSPTGRDTRLAFDSKEPAPPEFGLIAWLGPTRILGMHGEKRPVLKVVDIAGGGVRVVSEYAIGQRGFSVALDGLRLAVETDGVTTLLDVATMTERQLAENAMPAGWSPDGTRLLVYADVCGPTEHAEIIDPATGTRTTIGPITWGADWSSDGKCVLFLEDTSLVLRPSDGAGAPELVIDDIVAGGVQWSDDGRYLSLVAPTEGRERCLGGP